MAKKQENTTNMATLPLNLNLAYEDYQDRHAIFNVLGCLIKKPQLIIDFPLSVSDFVYPLDKIVFATIYNLAREGAQKLSVEIIESYLSTYFHSKLVVYEKYKGRSYIEMAINACELSNLAMDYETVKKYSLLRRYKSEGIDVSYYHIDKNTASNIEEEEEANARLKSASLELVSEYYIGKVLHINNDFKRRGVQESCKAGGEEARDQLRKWEEETTYGLSYASNFLTCATDGIHAGRLTLTSAGTNTGKTRMTLANIAHTFAVEFWDTKKKEWVKNPNGSQNRVLYIGTEQELRTEIEPVLEAYIAAVPQDHITHPELFQPGEKERVEYAIDVLDRSHIYMEYLPDFCLADLEEKIRFHVFQHGVKAVYFDYVHLTTTLCMEYRNASGQEGREDQILSNVSNKLKDWARKYNISIDTSTQVTGDFGNENLRDQRIIRGSKAMADKCDVCSIMSVPTEHELRKIEPILRTSREFSKQGGTLLCLSLYKNRVTKFKNIKIWIEVDFTTMRVHDLFVTDYSYNLMQDLHKVVVYVDEDTNRVYHYQDYATMIANLEDEKIPKKDKTKKDENTSEEKEALLKEFEELEESNMKTLHDSEDIVEEATIEGEDESVYIVEDEEEEIDYVDDYEY